MAKIICDYCEHGTNDKLCYKGGMSKCQGEFFLAKAETPKASENTLPIADVNGWLPLPDDKSGDWDDYHAAANNNCWLKFHDDRECRFDEMPASLIRPTHYKHP